MSRVNPQARCPACQSTIDMATATIGCATPKPRDLSVCVYCGVFLSFNTDLTLRLLRSNEFEALPDDMRAELVLISRIVGVLP